MNCRSRCGGAAQTAAWGLAIICMLGCAAAVPRRAPGMAVQDEAIAQMMLIMSRFELEVFMHLADEEARQAFIADFWKKRDPSPASAGNEFREDFDKRVQYANRWFHEKGPSGSGWNSERGNILLMLGFPDQREQMPMLDNPRIKAAEVWIYNNFALRLVFIDSEGFGRFRLERWPLELIDAIDQVKALGGAEAKKDYFRFRVKAIASGLRIEIPVRFVVVEEQGENVRAAFAVTVDVYRDYVKQDGITLTREFIETRAEFTARKNIVLDVPYPVAGAGRYFMDVIVEEMVTAQRFRDVLRFRRSGKK